jgi:hypothetical protein
MLYPVDEFESDAGVPIALFVRGSNSLSPPLVYLRIVTIKFQELLFPTVRKTDAGESAAWIAAIELSPDHLLDARLGVWNRGMNISTKHHFRHTSR